jgi:hypothetical protein
MLHHEIPVDLCMYTDAIVTKDVKDIQMLCGQNAKF